MYTRLCHEQKKRPPYAALFELYSNTVWAHGLVAVNLKFEKVIGWDGCNGQVPLSDAPTGNHGSGIHQDKYPV